MLIVSVFGFFALAICFSIIGPLQGASQRRGAWQIFLSDFLCLFVAIQVPISVVHAVGRANDARLATCLIFDSMAIVAFGGSWLFGVLLLSRAGIHSVRHRTVALVAALPLAWFGSLATALMSAWLFIVPLIPTARGSESWSWGAWTMVFLANAVMVGALCWAGWFTRTIVKSSQPRR